MTVLCHARPAIEGHTIPDGARRIDVTLGVNWGDADLRADFAKTASFCSFLHAAEWLADVADRHDGYVLKEGERAS